MSKYKKIESEWHISGYSIKVWANSEVYNKEYFTVELIGQEETVFIVNKDGSKAKYKTHVQFMRAILDFLGGC